MLYYLLLAMFSSYVAPSSTEGRYMKNIFPVTKSTVTYSAPYNLLMDIYQPTGDIAEARPLIILAHSGSFTGGSRYSDLTVDSLCVRFARRGYVTASIDYRLGTMSAMMADSNNAIKVLVKAMSDGKAAIRYFVKDAATDNIYKIDTNSIFVGGNSAGAVLFMHVAYVHNIDECPSYMQTSMLENGAFEGNSGNAGYNTKIKAVINLAGALNNTSYIKPFDIPCVSAHGTMDNTVPYNTGYFLNNAVHLQLSGLGTLESAFTAASVHHHNRLFTGNAHVPWNGNAANLNAVDTLVKDFLYNNLMQNANE